MFVILTLAACGLVPFLLILFLPKSGVSLDELPENRKVVVCVAARNEEGYIGKCLDALLQLNFPKQDYSILVADDASTDATKDILDEYCLNHPGISCFQVDQNDNRTRGKARALAQMTDRISCDYIAFTDADVEVSQDWLLNMVKGIGFNALISGTTLIQGRDCFSKWQSMDWLLGQLQIRIASLFFTKAPVAMGNNMLIDYKDYCAVGGYGLLPFSITEDVSLQKAFERKGYSTKMLFGADFLVLTKSEKSLPDLVNQRQRWAKAILDLPILLTLFLVLQGLFTPLLLLLCWFNVWLAVSFLMMKLLLNVFLFQRFNIGKMKWSYLLMISFEFYQWVLSLFVLTKLFFSPKVIWKGRR